MIGENKNNIILGNVKRFENINRLTDGFSNLNNKINKYNVNNNFKGIKKLFNVFSISSILLIILLTFVFTITGVSGQTPVNTPNEVSYCCEKTLSGAYCQNAPLEQCDRSPKSTGESYSASPTSCDSTSYCQTGCCYDGKEGICMENTPREACKVSNGAWSNSATCATPQCDLGCCVLGQQAAYVPLVRCKKLASLYGLQVDFRKDINDELSCINLAQAQDIGACVYESEFE